MLASENFCALSGIAAGCAHDFTSMGVCNASRHASHGRDKGPGAGDVTDMTQRGKAPLLTSSVVSVWQINQVFNGLLLSGSADGSVRVWRDYTFPRTQRLATAWQVSPHLEPSGP